MVSSSGLALAALIASRRLIRPSLPGLLCSAVTELKSASLLTTLAAVVTAIVAGTLRSSSSSRPRRQSRRRGRRAADIVGESQRLARPDHHCLLMIYTPGMRYGQKKL